MFEVLLANGTVIEAPAVSSMPGGVLLVYDEAHDGHQLRRMVLGPNAWLSYRERPAPAIDATPFAVSADDLAADVVAWIP